jgi:hypothetical protein
VTIPVKKIAAILLILNGIGALYGGSVLIMHPDGSGLQIPLYILNHSPFHNFLSQASFSLPRMAYQAIGSGCIR